jgi:predicted metal-dependent enzyme (double-stranded beta helix superfamily)
MFDTEKFIDDCRAANSGDESHKAVRELLAGVISSPQAILEGLGEPITGGINKLYQSPDLTILNVIWPPFMNLMPHNHNMWAVIGVYTGREDNIYWRRVEDRVEAAGAKALGVGDVEPLGKDIVHSVTNPIGRYTGAIHIYDGDFFEEARSEWDPETLQERPYDIEHALQLFKDANARFSGTSAT